MAIFTGATGNDTAHATTGVLTGFAGGSVTELQDSVGDSFSGLGGDDYIVAGSGNDTLRGGIGADTLFGGDGNDVIEFVNGELVAGDVIDGGSGLDTLSRVTGTVSVDLTAVSINSIETLLLGSSNDTIAMTGSQLAGFDTIDLGSGTDYLTVNLSGSIDFSADTSFVLTGLNRTTINAGAGDETLTMTSEQFDSLGFVQAGGGASWYATVDGGAGNDTLVIKNSLASLNWTTFLNGMKVNGFENYRILDNNGSNSITLTNGSLSMFIDGAGGDDSIKAVSGDDTLTGGDGADRIEGGNGADLVYINDGDFDAGEYINGGSGLDTIVCSGYADFSIGIVNHMGTYFTGNAGSNVSMLMSQNGGDLFVEMRGGTGDDTFNLLLDAANVNMGIIGSITSIEHFTFTDVTGQANSITTTAVGDVVNAGAGNDTVTGLGGNDTIDGGSGSADVAVYSGALANYTILNNGNGTYTVIANTGNEGTDTLSNAEFVKFGGVTYDINAVATAGGNQPPVGVNDSNSGDAVVEAGGIANGTAGDSTASGNVLTNDTDANSGDTKAVTGIRTGTEIAGGALSNVSGATTVVGTFGTLVINPDGTYTYTLNDSDIDTQSLNGGSTGTDIFTYRLADGTGLTDTAQLTITISGSNDTAVITGTSTGSATEDAGGVASGSLAASDVDTGEAAFLTSPVSGPSYGTFAINAAGAWTYDLNDSLAQIQALGATGSLSDTITVRSVDGTTKTITITINGTNDAPVVAAAISDQSATQGSAFSLTLASGTFVDVDSGDTLALSATLSNGDPLPDWLHFNTTTGQFSGTPGPGDIGAITVRVTATDTSTATTSDDFIINVSSGNVAPVGVNDSNAADPVTEAGGVANGTSGDNTAAGNVLGNDTDANAGDTMTVTGIRTGTEIAGGALTTVSGATSITGTFGTLLINPDGTYTYSLNNGDGDTQALGGGATGTDVFTYRLADGSGLTDTAQLTITINGANDAPTVVAGIADQNVTQGSALSLTVPGGTFADVDFGETLSLTATLSNGNTLPAWLLFNSTTGQFTGTPGVGDVGSITVRVTATDGSAASVFDDFVIDVAPSGNNQPPSISSQNSASVQEGFTGTVLDVDATDPENDSITYSLTGVDAGDFSINAATGQIIFLTVPDFEFSADDDLDGIFKITVSAGTPQHVTTQNITISVSDAQIIINDPAANNAGSFAGTSAEETMYGFGGNDSFTGNNGDDILIGGAGADTMNGGAGTDAVSYFDEAAVSINIGTRAYGGAAAGDVYFNVERHIGSNTGNDTFTGRDQVDYIDGAGGNDIFNTLGGTDTVLGGSGNDTINGGGGADYLVGGTGSDQFSYTGLTQSTAAEQDTIAGFANGEDLLNLNALDASATLSGNQNFVFVAAFTGEGQVRAFQSGADTIVEINTSDTTAGAEMSIRLTNFLATNFDASDFIA